ncbi:putative beta-lactamase precursor [Gemmatirosa kalamazoonensis]|uniref:Putative beta-lactamase n=1 Tax=Gemmatirosa kalamazoonensis TaxID=861299 RepID=W0RMR3_9BACT|nr:serine hydrolase [Gemmatirosa kalamazoonensis]AHG91757.1 putative beta-lactamase precursor [Gemmatirosa kalamazoonensis]
MTGLGTRDSGLGLLLAGCALALTLATTGCAHAQTSSPESRVPSPGRFTHADTARLHRTLDSLAESHRGILGYTVWNLDTGERLERRGDETFPTASLIKVSILVTVFDLVEKKMLSLDDPLTVLKIDQVPGSGTLQFMHPGIEISVRDAAWLMTTISDNTATNLLLDRIVIRRTWDKMESLGLMHTKVHSKSFIRAASVAMDSSVKYGLGVTTPNEMAKLFALLADGKAVSPAADSTMLDFLAHNQDETKLVRWVDGVRVAHKTGDVDQSRADCALFYLQSRVVVCGLTKENVDRSYAIDAEGNAVLARLGKAVADAWPRRAPNGTPAP